MFHNELVKEMKLGQTFKKGQRGTHNRDRDRCALEAANTLFDTFQAQFTPPDWFKWVCELHYSTMLEHFHSVRSRRMETIQVTMQQLTNREFSGIFSALKLKLTKQFGRNSEEYILPDNVAHVHNVLQSVACGNFRTSQHLDPETLKDPLYKQLADKMVTFMMRDVLQKEQEFMFEINTGYVALFENKRPYIRKDNSLWVYTRDSQWENVVFHTLFEKDDRFLVHQNCFVLSGKSQNAGIEKWFWTQGQEPPESRNALPINVFDYNLAMPLFRLASECPTAATEPDSPSAKRAEPSNESQPPAPSGPIANGTSASGPTVVN